jgi:acyl-coenzyme A thioesterase PaaI-like protein
MLNSGDQKPLLKSANKINPVGLKLEFKLDGNTAQTKFTLNESHQGLPGYVHDGVIALLMDEGMGWISRHGVGVKSVTAKLEIDFQSSAKIGEPLMMTAEITKNAKRLIEVAVRIEGEGGTSIAVGNCVQFVMESDHYLNQRSA